MIEKYETINLQSNNSIKEKQWGLSSRERLKVNALAPFYSINFSEMTVFERKKLLCEFLEYVNKANLEEIKSICSGRKSIFTLQRKQSKKRIFTQK
jgi:hypothetical protein